MEGTFFQNKKDSINVLYWHIILHVSTPKRRMEWVQNLLVDQVRVGLTLSMQQAARRVYHITNDDDLGRFTSHSIHVGTCVALHAINISSLDIKHALRWKSDSFLTYLCNLPCQAQRSARAVINFNPHHLDLGPGAKAA
jgi:hypothetical protein